MFRSLHVFVLAFALVAATDPPKTSSARSEPAKAANQTSICRAVQATGSRIVHRECHSHDEWEVIDRLSDKNE
jgi:hypothetical protein